MIGSSERCSVCCPTHGYCICSAGQLSQDIDTLVFPSRTYFAVFYMMQAGFLMGIIRRVREDGPDGGGADLKILPRSVEHAIRGLMDEVRCQ